MHMHSSLRSADFFEPWIFGSHLCNIVFVCPISVSRIVQAAIDRVTVFSMVQRSEVCEPRIKSIKALTTAT